jgi:hypothetical protein
MSHCCRRWICIAILASPLGLPGASFAWNWDGAAWADYRDFLGPIDASMKSSLQEIAADGIALGRVEGRMGQIGDSITESSAFFRNAILNGVTSNETGHNYDSIRSWLAYSGNQPADANSFYRDHGKGIPYANEGGWRISDAVAAGHPATAVEIGNGVTPGEFAWAILMFGTIDIDAANWNVAAWKETYRAFVQDFIDLGVIPVLSTIPPELAHVADGRAEIANDAILDLADEMNIPWIDYYGVILHHQPVNWLGTLISADGTHPTAATGGRGFSQVAQTSTDGYALRTKLAFDAAEKLRAIVFNDGPPDGATGVGEGAPLNPISLRAWPNPSSGAMSIRYHIDRELPSQFRIYDAAGRLVQSWEEGARLPGLHEAGWDGRDRNGIQVSAGSYIMTVESGTKRESARVVILR